MAIAKKRKKFFDVEIPIIGKTTQLLAFNIETLDNKLITYDLTRLLRGKSVLLQARVSVKAEKATAQPTQVKLLPYYIKRMVRKGTNYVEDSFSTPTKDKDVSVKIKPFLITRRKVSRAVRKALREKAKEELVKWAKDNSAKNLFEDVLHNQIQKPLSLKLKKIYPLSLCEIRILKLENKSQ